MNNEKIKKIKFTRFISQSAYRLLSQQQLVLGDCLQGVAYYRKIRAELGSAKNAALCFTVNAYYTVAVIEWSKLFGQYSEQTHWTNLFKHPEIKQALVQIKLVTEDDFRSEMCSYANISKQDFESFHEDFIDYRNKYEVHREHDPQKIQNGDLNSPKFDIPYATALFLEDIIRKIIAAIDDQGGYSTEFNCYADTHEFKTALDYHADRLLQALSLLDGR